MFAGKLLLLLSIVTVRFSCACIPMKPKDFDDVMPLTRIPPTNPLWTTEAMPTTAMNEETTSATSTMGTTSASSTSTSTASTTSTTTTQDPCDMCMIPTELPVTDDGAPCFATDITLPSTMISALPNGMNCELVVSGCTLYQITTDGGNCDIGSLSPNIICQNGVFASPNLGETILQIRCNNI